MIADTAKLSDKRNLLHSRLRNVRNKLTNASQAFGLAKKSPMAYLLNELGIEPDLKYL